MSIEHGASETVAARGVSTVLDVYRRTGGVRALVLDAIIGIPTFS